MKIHDLKNEGIVGDVKSSAKKFWHGTSGEISRERKWPQAYEKSMVAYKNALDSGDFDAIDKYSDLVNYFALKTGKPTLKSFENRLLRQKWTKQDFVDHVQQKYSNELNKAEHTGLEESKKSTPVWKKPNPKKKHKKLTPAKKAKAKARAKKAGRKYPNMVDNIWAAKLEESAQSVILKLDPEDPMNNSMIHVLGGAGSYSMAGLRRKARREAEEMLKNLQSEHPQAFRDAAYNVKQFANTLNTIVAALNELNDIRRRGGVKSRGIQPTE